MIVRDLPGAQGLDEKAGHEVTPCPWDEEVEKGEAMNQRSRDGGCHHGKQKGQSPARSSHGKTQQVSGGLWTIHILILLVRGVFSIIQTPSLQTGQPADLSAHIATFGAAEDEPFVITAQELSIAITQRASHVALAKQHENPVEGTQQAA
jgi:hypothetical protein